MMPAVRGARDASEALLRHGSRDEPEKGAPTKGDEGPAPQTLAELQAGRFVEGDSGVAASEPPAWLGPTQIACYARTKGVFEQHAFAFTLFFHVSLVIGFNLKPLLDALVFTADSATPAQALQRYMDTFAHLMDWHTGNIFDPTTTAYTSVEAVRKIHAGVRSAMEAKGKALAINQFNLGEYTSKSPPRLDYPQGCSQTRSCVNSGRPDWLYVSKNDEFCIKNEEFCIKNEEFFV